MSYLGVDPNAEGGGLSALLSGAVNRYQYTATAGQTTFDAVYSPGFVDVYKNGIRLDIADYTATDGSTVVLGAGAAAGELINIVGQEAYSVADVYSATATDGLLSAKAQSVHVHAISSVTGLQGELDAKQVTLVSGMNIKTLNGASLLGSGDVVIQSSAIGDLLTTANSPGSNWLLCNSAVYLQSSYSALYTKLGLLPNSDSGGITWTARTLPSSSNWRSVTYGNGVFVAVAVSSTIAAATSPDGITWTARTLPSSSNWISVTYGNGVFVAVAHSSASAATSPDGITWTARTLPSSSNWYAVTYGNGVFVAVAQSSASAATSPDGVTYDRATQFAVPAATPVAIGTTQYIKAL